MSIAQRPAIREYSISSASFPSDTEQVTPEIPGLDTRVAIARLGGNIPLYRQTLRLLHRNLPKYREELANAFTDDDGSRLRRAAHTLKGLAATIGATSMANTAEILEHATPADGPLPNRELYEALLADLAALAVRLDAFASAPPQATGAVPDFSSVSERLLAFLNDNDVMALSWFMDNRHIFAAHLSAAVLPELEKLLCSFAYDEAAFYLKEHMA